MGVDLKHSAIDTDLKNKIEGPAGMSESEICVATVNLIPILMERMRIARLYRYANQADKELIRANIDYLNEKVKRILML